MSRFDWPEKTAAIARLKTSWRELQEALRVSRKLDRKLKASRLVLRAVRTDPDCLNFHIERTVETVMRKLKERGMIDLANTISGDDQGSEEKK